MKVRLSEHQDLAPRTDAQLKGTLSASVADNTLSFNHLVTWKCFSLVESPTNTY